MGGQILMSDVSRGAGSPRSMVTGSLVVPCFREEATVARTIHELDDLARRRTDVSWEIVIVDDGSDDATSEQAVQAAGEVGTPVQIMRHRRNAGLGAALRTGFGASTGDVVVAVDCDLSYSVADLERLIDKWLESHPHVVIASPYMPGGQTVDVPHALEVRSRQANRFLSFCAYHDVKTITGMVRAYDGPFIRAMPLKAEGADIMVEIIYKAQILRARIEEIPATLSWAGLQTRAARSTLTSTRSRMMTYRSIIQGYLWRTYWVPLIPALVFGALAVVLIAMGKLGWDGLTITVAVLSAQLFVAALASLQAKRYFEELYNASYGLRRVAPVEPFRAPTAYVRSAGWQEPDPGVVQAEPIPGQTDLSVTRIDGGRRPIVVTEIDPTADRHSQTG